MTFNEIVSDYIQKYRNGSRAEMKFFEIQRGPSAAIRKAALSELPSGKRHPHQRRIPRKLLELVDVRLQAIASELALAKSFATLHQLITAEIGEIDGIGALTLYDIAHRIGAYFGKVPEFVYLHAGARIGARALNIKGQWFDPKILPEPFAGLSPSEIEDCLCIYNDVFEIADSPTATRSAKSSDATRPRRCLL